MTHGHIILQKTHRDFEKNKEMGAIFDKSFEQASDIGNFQSALSVLMLCLPKYLSKCSPREEEKDDRMEN